MKLRDEKIHIVLDGLSVLFLVLFVLILSSSAAAAQKIQLLEPSVSLAEINLQNQQPEQQLQFELIYKQTLQSITEVINDVQNNVKLLNFSADFPKQLNHSQIAIVLPGLFIFIFLVWLFGRKKTAFAEIKTCQSNIDSKVFTREKHPETTNEAFTDESHAKTEKIFFEKVIANSVDINKFISPGKKKSKRKGKNILEAAFEKDIFSNSIGFIQEDKSLIENNDPTESNLLDTVDEIRFVNEKTRNLKIDAFLDITQAEKLTDEMLSLDFDKIMSNKKVDVFIQEFEGVMSNLTDHTPAVNNSSNELENLLQFKISIHFIKVLSEMMQATYLKQFSTTVIEFLDDVVNGNARMTTDVTNRLVFVVHFYDRYIHSIKENHSYKIDV